MPVAFYELIGRIVVRRHWLRFRRQITIAGGVAAVLAAAGAYAIARREPPEG